jgi:hypothetical protein
MSRTVAAAGRPLVLRAGYAALALALVAALLIAAGCARSSATAARTGPCTLAMRPDVASRMSGDGAVVVYERNGGPSCVEELYAVYPDGRVVSDLGSGTSTTGHLSSDEVDQLLSKISNAGFFTDLFVTTYHPPCRACFRYSVTVTYNGQTKTVGAVDGGTDAPAEYWIVVSYLVVPLGVLH